MKSASGMSVVVAEKAGRIDATGLSDNDTRRVDHRDIPRCAQCAKDLACLCCVWNPVQHEAGWRAG